MNCVYFNTMQARLSFYALFMIFTAIIQTQFVNLVVLILLQIYIVRMWIITFQLSQKYNIINMDG